MRRNSGMQKILIIGGCGYTGSMLYSFLKKKNYFVQTIDLEWYGNSVNSKNIRINYKNLTRKFLSSFDVIILLAGYSSVKMTTRSPRKAFKNDVENFVSLLHKISHQRFIYASSSSIYGNTKKMNVSEDYDRYSPLNHYDLHKKIIDNYASLSNVDYYGLRLGTVCGYSPNLREDLMINKMYKSALEEKKITIHNPKMQRPILGMQDFCRAINAIIKGKPRPGIYNLASFNATIEEVSEIVRSFFSKTEVFVERGHSLYNFSVDTSKFSTMYNFSFIDDAGSIVSTLKKNYSASIKSIRD